MKVVVITGGMGGGKSLVCAMLAGKGVPVYDSDTAAKRLYDEDAQLLAAVVDLFGTKVLDEDGKLDRRALAACIFGNPSDLEALERLVHPAVYRDFAKWKQSLDGVPVVVYESALALQKGLPEGFADLFVYVDAPVEVRVERACARDGRPREEVLARIQAQSSDRNDPRVDYVIDNNATVDDLRMKVYSLYENIRQNENKSR